MGTPDGGDGDELRAGADVPWYAPLAGGYRAYATSPMGAAVTHAFLQVAETLRMVPAGTVQTHSVLRRASAGLVAGAQKQIFTPLLMLVCKKPEK